MLSKIIKAFFFVFIVFLVLSLDFLITPNYEDGFIRNNLDIDDALDISEVVIIDISSYKKNNENPEHGFFIRLLRGSPPSAFFERFTDQSMPKMQRGHVKNWADEKKKGQIAINQIVEKKDKKAAVSGAVIYPGGYEFNFYYMLIKKNDEWLIIEKNVLRNKE